MDRLAVLPSAPVRNPTDRLGRRVHDLRISVTDRCNFRCVYCMPKEVYGRDFPFLPRDQILSFEEIVRVARAFVELGVEKLRITGGEPLVRRDLPELIAMLAAAPDPGWRPDGPDPHHEWRGATGPRWAAPRRRARPRHRQPRLARRRDVHVDERGGLPGEPGAGRDRRRARGRPVADQGQHGHQTGSQRGLDRAARPLGSRGWPDPAVHRVHGRRAHERLATRRRRARVGGHRADLGRAAARSPRPELPGRGGHSLAICRRVGRGRRHRLRQRPVLRRLHAGSTVRRWPAVHLSVRRQGP